MGETNEDVENLRAFAREQAAEAAEMRLRVRVLERDNARLKRRLDRVYRSWTWRVGRMVLFPYHVVGRVRTALRSRRGG